MTHRVKISCVMLAGFALVLVAIRASQAQDRAQDPPSAQRDGPVAGDRDRDPPAVGDRPRPPDHSAERREQGPPYAGGLGRPGSPLYRPGPPGLERGPGRGRVLRGPAATGFGPGIGYALINDLERLKEIDPEMFELERRDRELDRRSLELSLQYRRASGERRESLAKELNELVAQHFEVRQKRRELQLTRLEEELKELRSALERRTAARQQIIEKRVSELTGKKDPLDF